MVTNYFRNCVMGNVFGSQTTPALPTAYWLGMSSTAPTVDGTNITEPSGGAYARVQLGSLSAPSDGTVTNSTEVEYAETTSDWGTMTHFVVFDAATGGHALVYDELTKPRVVQSENQVRFKAGALSITLQNPA